MQPNSGNFDLLRMLDTPLVRRGAVAGRYIKGDPWASPTKGLAR